MKHDAYVNPLCTRYAGVEMQKIFSDDRKYSCWRKLWLYLAEAEKQLGIPITDRQIEEMKIHLVDIDYERAAREEQATRHDVMAHIRTFAACCPEAAPIIHLGATSCFVGDNTDVINMRDAMILIRKKLISIMESLAVFAEITKDIPTLGFTHFQPAQPTTVGKRACLWLQDLDMDLKQLDFQLSVLLPLGCKGATGTAASFLALFDGDAEKVRKLEEISVSIKYIDGAQHVFLNGTDVNDRIRTQAVSDNASKISAIAKVREKLVAIQQEMALSENVVMDGRDIGSVVLPKADLKIYLTASVEVRAQRRYNELIEKGQQAELETIAKEIEERDYRDMHRENSPLVRVPDAKLVDTSDLNIDEATGFCLGLFSLVKEDQV